MKKCRARKKGEARITNERTVIDYVYWKDLRPLTGSELGHHQAAWMGGQAQCLDHGRRAKAVWSQSS